MNATSELQKINFGAAPHAQNDDHDLQDVEIFMVPWEHDESE